jgi:hypothetical protein
MNALFKKAQKTLYSDGVKSLLKLTYCWIKKLVINSSVYIELSVGYRYKHPHLFNHIEIETLNRCNGLCTFCPVNINENPRPYAKMSEILFHKIIDELKTIGYSGDVSLSSNNEPFLDENIMDFIVYARAQIPNAHIYINTNATALSFDKFLNVIPYLDKLKINNYNDDFIMLPNVKEINEYCLNHSQLNKKVFISLRKQNQILTSRGGQAPNKMNQKASSKKCNKPFKQLIIRPDGKVSLCCNDALGVYTMGDTNKQTLLQIWNSEYYCSVKKEMRMNGRKNLELCKCCDA